MPGLNSPSSPVCDRVPSGNRIRTLPGLSSSWRQRVRLCRGLFRRSNGSALTTIAASSTRGGVHEEVILRPRPGTCDAAWPAAVRRAEHRASRWLAWLATITNDPSDGRFSRPMIVEPMIEPQPAATEQPGGHSQSVDQHVGLARKVPQPLDHRLGQVARRLVLPLQGSRAVSPSVATAHQYRSCENRTM